MLFIVGLSCLDRICLISLTKQVCQHVIGMNPASVGDPNKEPEIVAKEAKKPIVEEPRGKY